MPELVHKVYVPAASAGKLIVLLAVGVVNPMVVVKVPFLAVIVLEALPCKVKVWPTSPMLRELLGVMVLTASEPPTDALLVTLSAVPAAVKDVAPLKVLAVEPLCVYPPDVVTPVTPVNAPVVEISRADESSWKVPVALPIAVLAEPEVLMLVAPVTVSPVRVPTVVIFVNEPLARSALTIVPLKILALVTASLAIVATALLLRVISPLTFWFTQALPLYCKMLPLATEVMVNVPPCSLATVGLGYDPVKSPPAPPTAVQLPVVKQIDAVAPPGSGKV